MERYISGIDELKLGEKIFGGSCSNIYAFEEDTYFKEFNEEYRDLSDSINIEFYETIKFLSDIKGMPFIIRGREIYRSKKDLFGYSMPTVSAKALHSVSDDVLVDDIFRGFILLRDDIRVLADNHVKTEDIGGDNIIFNGNMYLLDLDLSLVDRRYVPDELYERTINSVISGIRGKVLGDTRYGDVVKSDDCESYFTRLKDACSDGLGRDAKTICEMKLGYQKIKSIYKS